MSKGFLSGRLTTEPVRKTTPTGKQVCTLRVAYSYPRGTAAAYSIGHRSCSPLVDQ
jgi:single-stranded DNA-binding protein